MKIKNILAMMLSVVIITASMMTHCFAIEGSAKDPTMPYIKATVDEQNGTITLSTVNFPENVYGFQVRFWYSGITFESMEEATIPAGWELYAGSEFGTKSALIIDSTDFENSIGDQDILVMHFSDLDKLESFLLYDAKVVTVDKDAVPEWKFEGVELSNFGIPNADIAVPEKPKPDPNITFEEPDYHNPPVYDNEEETADERYGAEDGDNIDIEFASATDTDFSFYNVKVGSTAPKDTGDSTAVANGASATKSTTNPTTKGVDTGVSGFFGILAVAGLSGIAVKRRK